MGKEFKLPELGENIESGEVVNVLVHEGDVVSAEQSVLELETDKATLEVPVPFGGTVQEIRAKQGDTIKVGQVVLVIEENGAEESGQKQAAAEKKPSAKPTEPTKDDGQGEPDAQKTDTEAKKEDERDEVPPKKAKGEEAPEPSAEAATERDEEPPARRRDVAPAAPSIRGLARELGVDIDRVEGSGSGGRISEEDVKRHVRSLLASRRAGAAPAGPPALPDLEKWGPVERKPMDGIRRKTSEHVTRAWTTVAHVTHHDTADVTELEALRKRYAARVEAAGGKLTVTAVALKVAASALNVFPKFAAALDTDRNELVYRKYRHLGVAVDTERGLLVPVIRDVDQKNLVALSQELTQIADKAREGKLSVEEMRGGVFTITNLGGIGGTSFSPIVNWPEVAILGLSRSTWQPVTRNGTVEPRLHLPLSLSYDHRVIDGAEAARFLRWVAEAFEDPFVLSLEG